MYDHKNKVEQNEGPKARTMQQLILIQQLSQSLRFESKINGNLLMKGWRNRHVCKHVTASCPHW